MPTSSPERLAVAPAQIRNEIRSLTEWLESAKRDVETNLVRLANLAFIVRERRLWSEWQDGKTGAAFTSFDQWVRDDLGVSRAHVYRLLSVREHLSLPAETMQSLGAQRVYDLARLGRDRPQKVKQVIEQFEASPEMTAAEFRELVQANLTDHKAEKWVWKTICMRESDAHFFDDALAVENAVEPVQQPDTSAGMGTLVIGICEEYLAGEEQKVALEEIQKAKADQT